ncbi:MAG: hypothetical protein D6738_01410 [Acidobacteria bacterium]|nr:MAG: hypothetical protein D6738_01410 [Acidobacteriota bacterium]
MTLGALGPGRPGVDLPRTAPPLALRLALEIVASAGLGAAIGALVGVLAAVLERGRIEGPLVAIGALTGGTAALIAAITGREVLPRLSAFSTPVRYVLGLLTLLGGAVAATSLVLWIYPRYVVYAWRYVLLVGATTGLIAMVAGVLVFVYEDLNLRLARTREMLAAERVRQVQARERAARAELKALQARINPHFFFNALNTAAALVQEDPASAEQLLERFSGLFRYAFRRGGEATVPLEDEAAFIRDYLEIERARFGDKLTFAVTVDPSVAAYQVPPLILQPLVENAVVHGRDPETGAGRIEVVARRDDGRVVIEVRDDGPGPGETHAVLRRGHALENVAARVEALGGRLSVEPGPGGGTRAVLTFVDRATPGREQE